MINKIIGKVEPMMKEEINRFSESLKKIQAGRINPSLVEDFKISYYNSLVPLKQIASIMVSGLNNVVVAPWDKESLATIEGGLRESDLGFSIINDGSSLRISLPPLSEEGRKDLIKQVSGATEETRIGLRNIREKIWKDIQGLERNGEISEDDRYRGESELNKLIEKYNQEAAKLSAAKETEIKQV